VSLHIDRDSGLLREARQVNSPNCDERPDNAELDLLVIHNISLPPQKFGGPWIDALFSNTLDPNAHPYFAEIHQMQVSSHILIRRDGELVQYVPFHKRAWHAGVSNFEGRERCNDFSIGIELEGADEVPYEQIQYVTLAKLITALEQAYPTLSRKRMVGHNDIAPERKTDPGPAFDWDELYATLSHSNIQSA
jgi:N-acetyl-anhydromuramoyl-L-alanine amidase